MTKFSSVHEPDNKPEKETPAEVMTKPEMLVTLTKIARDTLVKPSERMAAIDFILKLQGWERSTDPVTVIDDIPAC